MEIINRYPKATQWFFLLFVFFALCLAIKVPEGYEFAKAGTEFIDKDKLDQTPWDWAMKMGFDGIAATLDSHARKIRKFKEKWGYSP